MDGMTRATRLFAAYAARQTTGIEKNAPEVDHAAAAL